MSLFLRESVLGGPLQKNRNLLKTFMHWDAWKSIKLININFNKYPSSCKIQGKKWWWTKLWIKNLLKQWGEAKCDKQMCTQDIL
jgi:hypothetical protein